MRWGGRIVRPRVWGWPLDRGRGQAWQGALVALVLAVALTVGGSAFVQPPSPAAGGRVPIVPRVLFVGDSISAGWFASRPAASFPERLIALLHHDSPESGDWYQVIAVPGRHAADGVRDLRALATIPRADLIVVEYGTNDFGSHPESPADFARAYATLLGLLVGASPHAIVACVTVWGAADHVNTFGATPAAYNRVIIGACQALPHGAGIPVDITPLYAVAAYHGPVGHRTYIPSRADAFHPNDAGHDAIARAIFAALATHALTTGAQ